MPRRPSDLEPISDDAPRGRGHYHEHSGRAGDIACKIAQSDRITAAHRLFVLIGGPAAILGMLAWGWAQFDGLRLGMAAFNARVDGLIARVDKVLDLHEKRLDRLEDRALDRRAASAGPEAPL